MFFISFSFLKVVEKGHPTPPDSKVTVETASTVI